MLMPSICAAFSFIAANGLDDLLDVIDFLSVEEFLELHRETVPRLRAPRPRGISASVESMAVSAFPARGLMASPSVCVKSLSAVRRGWRPRLPTRAQQILEQEHAVIAERKRAVHRVLQFADVAGPTVRLHHPRIIVGDARSPACPVAARRVARNGSPTAECPPHAHAVLVVMPGIRADAVEEVFSETSCPASFLLEAAHSWQPSTPDVPT